MEDSDCQCLSNRKSGRMVRISFSCTTGSFRILAGDNGKEGDIARGGGGEGGKGGGSRGWRWGREEEMRMGMIYVATQR